MPENTTDVVTLTATDADDDPLEWSTNGGADQAAFDLTLAGVLTFATAPDYENPTDTGGDNSYEVEVGVTDNEATTYRTLTVTVTDVAEQPTPPPSNGLWSATLTVRDVATGVLGCSSGVTGSECSNTSILTDDTFTHDGTTYAFNLIFLRSNGRLEIEFDTDLTTATQALTLDIDGTAFAFEDADTKTVRGRRWNNAGLIWSAGTTVALSLTSTPEAPNTAPVITTTSPQSVPENTTAVVTLAATDADMGDALTWSKNGGADADKFTLTPGGVLTFATAPDYEAPTDSGADNGYVVIVRVSDRTATADLTLTVNVTDVAEQPAPPDTNLPDRCEYSGQLHEGSWQYFATSGDSAGQPSLTIHRDKGEARVCGHNRVGVDAGGRTHYCTAVNDPRTYEWVPVTVDTCTAATDTPTEEPTTPEEPTPPVLTEPEPEPDPDPEPTPEPENDEEEEPTPVPALPFLAPLDALVRALFEAVLP